MRHLRSGVEHPPAATSTAVKTTAASAATSGSGTQPGGVKLTRGGSPLARGGVGRAHQAARRSRASARPGVAGIATSRGAEGKPAHFGYPLLTAVNSRSGSGSAGRYRRSGARGDACRLATSP